jgi:hypothetical protein
MFVLVENRPSRATRQMPVWVGDDGVVVADGFRATSMSELGRQLLCFGYRRGAQLRIARSSNGETLGYVALGDLLDGAGGPADAPSWWYARPARVEAS